jgi:phosphoglucosamine mutase
LINEFAVRAVEYAATIPGQQTDGQHLIELYIYDHVRRCPAQSLEGLKVVLDCANGAASRVAPEAFKRLGAEVVVINDAIDGRSIGHQCGSEYTRESPQDLVKVVRHHRAEYGFAFDGDGDRLVVVDSEERLFDGNDLLFVLAMYFRSQGLLRGDAVVTNDVANRGLEEALSRAGARVIYTSKGNKNLEAAMWGGDYLLGGEPGGNIVINDGHHTAADAVYTALVLGGVLVRKARKEMATRYESALSTLAGIPAPDSESPA